MEIMNMTTSTFWKGEAGIKGIVAEGSPNGCSAEYKVNLHVKGSQIYDYSCSCVNGNSYQGMCGHAQFVWETWQAQQKQGDRRPVVTAQEVRVMIREYTNREVAKIIREKEVNPVSLLPKIHVGKKLVQLELKIGRSRFYQIKDLQTFAQAVANGTYIEYSKSLGFHHSIAAFEERDRELVMMVIELVNLYQEHYEQFHKGAFVAVPKLRELNLNKAGRDRFFRLMEGRELELEDSRGRLRTVRVQSGNFELQMKIRKAGRDGIRMTIDQELFTFSGERHLYVCSQEQITCLPEHASGQLAVFFEQMQKGWGDKLEVDVQDRDIPIFYERVLQQILPYSRLDVQEVDLDSYRPPELKVRFDFDSSRVGELTMIPTLSYGDYSFHPVEDEKVPRTVCRDVPGEFRISQAITKYFKYREEQSSDGESTECLVIRDDDDALYLLLTEGMPEFQKLGEVYFSEAAKKIQMLPPPKVNIGIQTAGSWLELTIDADGLTSAELARILSAYEQRKPYYRLKQGQFLQLDDNGLMTIARIAEGLDRSKLQLQKTLQVPMYRALYLDSVLKEGPDVTLYRDTLFRNVIRGMKSVEDSDFEVPLSLQPVLRKYQKTGYCWLRTLDQYGFGGILADDMGLGKTIQVIALLLEEKQNRENRSTSLVICPASLVYNWENELQRFAPELTVCCIAGAVEERNEYLKEWEQYDVLITSYDLLKRDIEQYMTMELRFQIIDEAQYIKNPVTQSAKSVKLLKARTRFALTGTPIENRISELWSIFDYLMPGFLFGYQRFKREYEIPIVKEQDEKALKKLHQLTGPFVLRRLKRDVLKELPEKLETVVYSRCGAKQHEIYTAEALQLKKQLEQLGDLQILAQLTRLRQLCCDPSLCYSNYKGESAKLDTCMELLTSAIEGGHKILLFSQFTSMLSIIEKRLQQQGITYYLLTGATKKEERIRLTGAFQQDDVPVFLISLKAGGTGLNLTAADMVIHYDPWWNVAVQNQATDRAHRIGQTKQVSVFRLIMKDTIEENVLKLQESKKNLAEQIITAGTMPLGSLSREDLLALL